MQPVEEIELSELSRRALNGRNRSDPRESEAPITPDDAWKMKNMLSLDGGGIRGLWSLLVLDALMEKVGLVEEIWHSAEEAEDEFDGLHSFWPEQWPSASARGPYDDDERTELNNVQGEDRAATCQAMKESRRFLPCHYFDYIFGSSTGALIAIMLGRFRMSVADCLTEYKTLGGKIFGRPRFPAQINFGIGLRKYRAKTLENLFRTVTHRRCERRDKNAGPVTFHVKAWENLCRTCVTTNRQGADARGAKSVLLRSYDHHKRHPSGTGQSAVPRLRSRVSTNATLESGASTQAGSARRRRPRQQENPTHSIEYGPASNYEIWQIARAATAAPFYFNPFKMELEGERTTFEDGGFGVNNPTDVGVQEIRQLRQPIGIVVSVGTARVNAPHGTTTIPILRNLSDTATDTERVHKSVQRLAAAVDDGFKYFRLNEPELLDVHLDEWKPSSGSKTLEKIRSKFLEWKGRHQNDSDLQECADSLVRRRRARISNRDRWKHFAIGAVYRCLGCLDVEGCGDEFKTKASFKSHLLQHHGLQDHGFTDDNITDDDLRDCMTQFLYREPRPS